MVGPLADVPVTRVGHVGHLVLEDVVATGSVSVLVEHHPRACASCLVKTEMKSFVHKKKKAIQVPPHPHPLSPLPHQHL